MKWAVLLATNVTGPATVDCGRRNMDVAAPKAISQFFMFLPFPHWTKATLGLFRLDVVLDLNSLVTRNRL